MKKYLQSNQRVSMYILFVITLIVAASSILYELLLGQTLSAFLGNTIREYSITIGLYMFSMGVGAFLAEGRLTKNPLSTLLWVEIALTIIGGTTIITAYLLHAVIASTLLFTWALYLLIIIIGTLTGMEIPLLFALGRTYKKRLDNTILGIDYVGAFLGSVLFAFYFYTVAGLTATAFIVALGNTVAGLLLYTQHTQEHEASRVYLQLLLLCITAVCMIVLLERAPDINNALITLYIS